MNNLIFLPRPLSNESLASIFLRASDPHHCTPRNFLSVLRCGNVSPVTMLRNQLSGERTAMHNFADLDNWTPPPIQKKLALQRQFNSWMRYSSAALCPICAEEGWYPFQHDFTFIEACTLHGCRLQKTCAKCDLVIVWNRKRFGVCDCRSPLTNVTTASEEDLAEASLFEQWLADENILMIQGYLELRELLRRRYNLFGTGSHVIHRLLLGDASVFPIVVNPIIARLFELPKRAALAPLFCAKSMHIRSLAEALLDYAKTCNVTCDQHSLMDFTLNRQELIVALGTKPITVDALFATHFKEYSQSTRTCSLPMNALLKLYRALEPVPKKSDHCTALKDITNTKKIPLVDLIGMLLSGEIRTTYFDKELPISEAKIDLNIEQITRIPAYHVTIKEAMDRLNTYHAVITSLIKVGLLKAKQQRHKNNRYIFSESDIEEFRAQFVFGSELAWQTQTAAPRLSDKLMSAGVHPVAGPQINNCTVYVFRRSDIAKIDLKKVAAMEFYVAQCGRKTKGSRSDDNGGWLSSTQVANLMNVSANQLYMFIAPDLLVSGRPDDAGSRRCRYFRAESVRKAIEFRNSIVSAQHAASSLSISVRELKTRIAALGGRGTFKFGSKSYIGKSDFDKLKLHCETYVNAQKMAEILGTLKQDIYNGVRLGKLSPLRATDHGYIRSLLLFSLPHQ